MPQIPSLVIVGANKGGVGKTTVARLLVEYFTIQGLPVAAYDTEYPRGGLSRYHSDITTTIDIRNTQHQCILWEDLRTAEGVTIIDLKAGELSRTLKFLKNVGAFDEVANGALNLNVLHLLGSSVASLAELEATQQYRALCGYYIVKNFISHAEFFARNGDLAKPFERQIDPDREIIIPRLEPFAFEHVDLAGVPFSSFVLDEMKSGAALNASFVLRGYVNTWLERAWANFERAGLDSLASRKVERARSTSSKGRVVHA